MRYLDSYIVSLFVLVAFSSMSGQPAAALPAFPGAEGFGAASIGGRGGLVIEVTNLNDSGPGSLRAAVEAGGPRIVVFRVSGNIELQSRLKISNSYITIAGQTAPGAGICLNNYQFQVSADHVIVRYMRFRPGDNKAVQCDAVWVSKGRNIIIDHCSASWSVDETLSVAAEADELGNVTIQWCMIAESLNCSIHSKDCHGYGYTNIEEYINWLPLREPMPTRHKTDLNGDDTVDFDDFAELAGCYHSSSGGTLYDEKCDLNNDGAVSVEDLCYITQDWLWHRQDLFL